MSDGDYACFLCVAIKESISRGILLWEQFAFNDNKHFRNTAHQMVLGCVNILILLVITYNVN